MLISKHHWHCWNTESVPPAPLTTKMNPEGGKLQSLHSKMTPNNTVSRIRDRKFRLLFWNSGGCLLSRIRTNPQLSDLISSLPDMFVFVETMLYKTSKTSSLLPNYDVITHLAKRKSHRRGISVFYSSKIRYRLTTDFASKKFDIIWLRLKLRHKDQIFCFFSAPELTFLMKI